MEPARVQVDVYPTDGEAYEAAADDAVTHLRAAMARGRATVALSGGRGGRAVMLALAARDDAPWDRIEWYWADERCVPAGDPRSNVKVAQDSLLEPRQITPARIHPPPVDLGDPDAIAAAYATTLVEDLGRPPVFDLILLGLGPNAHTASLMPRSGALHATAPVVGVPASEVETEPHVGRITLTLPVLRAARRVLLVATGADKAQAVSASLGGPEEPDAVPGQLVRPGGSVRWLVDLAAAAELMKTARPVGGQ